MGETSAVSSYKTNDLHSKWTLAQLQALSTGQKQQVIGYLPDFGAGLDRSIDLEVLEAWLGGGNVDESTIGTNKPDVAALPANNDPAYSEGDTFTWTVNRLTYEVQADGTYERVTLTSYDRPGQAAPDLLTPSVDVIEGQRHVSTIGHFKFASGAWEAVPDSGGSHPELAAHVALGLAAPTVANIWSSLQHGTWEATAVEAQINLTGFNEQDTTLTADRTVTFNNALPARASGIFVLAVIPGGNVLIIPPANDPRGKFVQPSLVDPFLVAFKPLPSGLMLFVGAY